MNTRIYIATHKKYREYPLKDYCILQVGAKGKKILDIREMMTVIIYLRKIRITVN